VNKKVFVIVVTYNGMQWIDNCFSSLLNSSIPLHIIAVDNASTDATCAFIKDKYADVELIKTGSNLGFGKANNIGLKKAIQNNSDYVFLLNQDTWVKEDCIEKLIQHLEHNNSYSLISPFHYNYDKKGTEFYFEQFVLKHYTKAYNADSAKNIDILETEFVHAAAWMLPLKTINIVGGFDPLFKHTGEDNDFIQRLQYKKLKAGIVTDAFVYHKGTNAGLVDSDNNYTQFLNTALLKLKNPKANIGGAFLLFYRTALRHFLQSIFYKCPAKKNRRKIFAFVFKNTFNIMSSRRKQLKENAYM